MKNKFLLIISLIIINTIFLNGQNKTIKLISPDFRSKLIVNQNYSISWISNNVDLINIEYSTVEGSWESIYKKLFAGAEIISWNVPSKLAGSKIKLRIIDSITQEVYDSTKNWVEVISLVQNESIEKIAAQQKILQILPLGNSITFDNRKNDTRVVEDKIGYRYHLYKKLIDAGIKFDFIGSEHAGSNFLPSGFDDNGGFPGIHDHELANLLITGKRNQPPNYSNVVITPGPYLETYTPDIILLHIGTNDNQLPNGTDPADVEDILNEVKRFEDSTGTEISVILTRIIDRVPNQTYVNKFNDNVETMAMDRVNNSSNPAYPDKIIMVDMEDSAEIDYTIDEFGTINNGIKGDMSDDLHPNDKGYYKMASVWFNSIITTLPKLSTKIFLEGAYLGSENMSFLLSSLLSFPKEQPFSTFPWFFDGTEKVESIPSDVVDWVLVSLRNDLTSNTEIAKRAAFLRKDGQIVDLNGLSNLAFVVNPGNYYVLIEHRNHLPVMSSNKVLITQ